MSYFVSSYYFFHPVADVEAFRKDTFSTCKELGLKGRIYVSSEGINGGIAGTQEAVEAYKVHLWNTPGFEHTEFKTDPCDRVPFARLAVKIREEIVTLKAGELNPAEGGRHLSPAEWREVLEKEKDYILIDARNNYESKIGHFEGAICPDVKNFYDFPEWVEQQNFDPNKKVLMYCTGGIRCEKFSVLMKKKGFEDVNQLHGGILNYAKEEGGAHFKGKCFVFDDRLVVPVNENDTEPISTCEITGEPADTFLNCANMDCNRLFIASEAGARKYEGCCSEECMDSPKRRPFNPDDVYAPFRKWYNYFGPEFKEISKNKDSVSA